MLKCFSSGSRLPAGKELPKGRLSWREFCRWPSADEARRLAETYTDFNIPDEVIERLKAAGDQNAQKKEGLTICAEIIKKLKNMTGLRGVHILSGGNEAVVPEIISAAAM